MKTTNMNSRTRLLSGVALWWRPGKPGLRDCPASRRRLGKLHFILLPAAVAALAFLGGCIAYVHTSLPIVIDTGWHSGHHPYQARPHPQYYCYDCHGYTYFDPYYDYCVSYGFRFNWNAHPSVRRYYRERHSILVKNTPRFGEYKYKPDYRSNSKYNRPPDYQTWKKSQKSQQLKSREESKGKSRGESQKKSKGESRDESQGKSDRGK